MSETPLQKGSPLSMSYQALYRKWRPDTFEDVKGQDHIVTTLKNQILADRIGHAYLFCGTRGTGKTSVAKIFARAVNCEHPVNGSPCGECPACKALHAGHSPHGLPLTGCSQLTALANIFATLVLPVPLVPQKRYACPILSANI